MKKLSTREIAISASLAAISAITQLIHIGYQSPQWGMWVDVVAVSWIIAFFLFGVKSSLLVSLLGWLVITLFAPDTWLGASMKWVATAPMFVSLHLWLLFQKKKIQDYKKYTNLIVPVIIALFVRTAVVLPLNYYIAIPIWTGMTTQQAINLIPWYIIAGFNTIQGILDVVLAWILVYKFQLSKFSKKK